MPRIESTAFCGTLRTQCVHVIVVFELLLWSEKKNVGRGSFLFSCSLFVVFTKSLGSLLISVVILSYLYLSFHSILFSFLPLSLFIPPPPPPSVLHRILWWQPLYNWTVSLWLAVQLSFSLHLMCLGRNPEWVDHLVEYNKHICTVETKGGGVRGFPTEIWLLKASLYYIINCCCGNKVLLYCECYCYK